MASNLKPIVLMEFPLPLSYAATMYVAAWPCYDAARTTGKCVPRPGLYTSRLVILSRCLGVESTAPVPHYDGHWFKS